MVVRMVLLPVVLKASRLGMFSLFLVVLAAMSPIANAQTPASPAKDSTKPAPAAPTAGEADRFISQAETRLLDLWIKGQRADWLSENFITDDTEAVAADANAAIKAATADLARQAKRYEKLTLPPDVARKFKLLKLSVDIPAPRNPAAQAEFSKIAVSLDTDYGKGTWCPHSIKQNCTILPHIQKIM